LLRRGLGGGLRGLRRVGGGVRVLLGGVGRRGEREGKQ